MAGWQLSALLTELRKGRLHDMSDQVAGATTDYLWTDAQLVSYLNEAHRRFARRSLVIRDNTTSSVTQFTTVNGQAYYTLHKSVVAVLSVRMAGDNTDLAQANHAAIDTYTRPDTFFFDPSQLDTRPPGKPLAWTTDESVLSDPNGSFSTMNLRLYPVVAAPYGGIVGSLRVIREPINDFSLSNLAAYPEIPADHHLDMIDWAAYLALSNVDTDIAGGNAPERAEKFAARFEMHCRDARREVMRKLMPLLAWGFGQNGWAWES